jgi:serine phosphatase RsbU (regulator of sigma subunit)
MIDGVKASLASFVGNAEQSDDITMLALKRT